MSRRILIVLAAVLAAFAACRRPSSQEDFIAGAGPYVFSVDMADTTQSYDFSFYTRLDARPHLLEGVVDMPLDIQWVSPSREVFTETVYLPLTDAHSTFYSRQIRRPYRTEVIPVESGIWELSVTVPDTVSIPGFRGLGLIQSIHGAR